MYAVLYAAQRADRIAFVTFLRDFAESEDSGERHFPDPDVSAEYGFGRFDVLAVGLDFKSSIRNRKPTFVTGRHRRPGVAVKRNLGDSVAHYYELLDDG